LVAGLVWGFRLQAPSQFPGATRPMLHLPPRIGSRFLTVAHANGMEPSAAALSGPGEEFDSAAAHAAFLKAQGALPRGFKVGVSKLTFNPVEEPGRTNLPMRLTLLLLDEPSNVWASMFTSNAFPGSPIKVWLKISSRVKAEQKNPKCHACWPFAGNGSVLKSLFEDNFSFDHTSI